MTFRELIRATPGRRFSQRYEHRQHSAGAVRRSLAMVGGTLLVVTGCLMMLTPGPGLLFVLLGAALIATASERAARALDALELRLRAFLRRLSA